MRRAVALAAVAWLATGARAQGPSPAEAARASGRYFGVAVASAYLNEPAFARLLPAVASSVTPEWEMKWGAVEPSQGVKNWRASDEIVAFAHAHGLRVRGHALVWHLHQPRWIEAGGFAREELKTLLLQHVSEEAARYRGQVYAWDVVNEPFETNGAWRRSLWYDAIGPGYVRLALEAAHAADPAAKLYVNDYGIEGGGPKTDALLALVARLKREGAPLDGVGLQAHFVAGKSPENLEATMKAFADLGVDVAITELDVRQRLPATPESRAVQTATFGAVAAACRQVARCVGVTTWGLTDAHSWIPDALPGYGEGLAYDANGQPKPAAEALARGLAP